MSDNRISCPNCGRMMDCVGTFAEVQPGTSDVGGAKTMYYCACNDRLISDRKVDESAVRARTCMALRDWLVHEMGFEPDGNGRYLHRPTGLFVDGHGIIAGSRKGEAWFRSMIASLVRAQEEKLAAMQAQDGIMMDPAREAE